ncbi:helix-turn-helix transcriptional regulator [Parvibaculum sp.]|uniref:helix-turn-helix transcriptional regulator n=1 Tax=Parvibaculum sp. TaxID=2024848 RepID=UPI002B5D812C|nr:helix-turn-helix transcriptional regulator [Parvibaculum sp.]HUD51632.1 helix-turn-helix transcriptional regulator [Parvibaculum sp.]
MLNSHKHDVRKPMPSPAQFSALIGQIYNGSFEDVSWKRSLEQLREHLGAKFVTLSLVAKTTLRQEATINAGEFDLNDFAMYQNEYQRHAPKLEMKLGEITTINDWLSDRRYSNSGKFHELLELGGINHYMGSWVCSLEEVDCFLRIMRPTGSSPFDKQEQELISLIAPHFARALEIRTRLSHSEVVNQIYAEAMDRLAVGGIVLDEGGKLVAMNSIAQSLLERRDGIVVMNGAIRAVSTQEDKALQKLIKFALETEPGSGDKITQALSISRPSGARDLGVVVNPIRLSARVGDRWSHGAAIFIRDAEIGVKTDPAVLRQLFGFTQAEASLAMQLAKGDSLEQAAAEQNIRYNTARAHLRSMFEKTGVTRQAELVRILVNGVAPLASLDRAS